MIMRVDIWSDVVCPWCYIGKRRFERALAGFSHRCQVEVAYRSFELDPAFPGGEPMPVARMLSARYRLDPAQAAAAEQGVAARAAADGLPFTVDRVIGNTFDAHRLIQLARERGLDAALVGRLYRAYFGEGRPVFAADLAGLAAGAGLDAADARRVLDDGGYADAVRADEDQARRIGITGVPFFVLDGRFGVSGAQPVAVLAQALREACSAASPRVAPG